MNTKSELTLSRVARSNRSELLRHLLVIVVGYGAVYVLFFAPVLFSSRILAPGDGISYFLPSYYARTLYWDTSIWGGFPSIADAPRMFWYPPALVFALLPHSWHLFLLSAYVLSSSFTYAYVLTITKSRLAAYCSGLIYGMCGFMIAHIGHAALVHTIAWLPLILFSLERLESQKPFKRSWFVVGTFAVGSSALAGHPQMFVYVLILSFAYGIAGALRLSSNRGRYLVATVVLLFIGTGMAALQLVPTAELAHLSLRAVLTFPEFVAYQMPLRQLPMLIFPFLFGGSPASLYATPYFGAWPSSADGWGASELTGYVGLLPLILGVVGASSYYRKGLVRFWLIVVLVALLLAIGESTPLASLTYHLPVIDKFRAPARYFFAVAFGASVLAGFGVRAIQLRKASSRNLAWVIAGFLLFLSSCVLSLNLFSGKIQELALQRLGRTVSLNPIRNPALFVPLLVFGAGTAILIVWHKQPERSWRVGFLLAWIIVDLASFGWFYEWRYRSPQADYLVAPADATPYANRVAETHQRILPVRGGTALVSEMPPNLSKLWGLTSTSGYGPLILGRTSRMLTMPPHGSVDESWRDPANQSVDLFATRYILVPPSLLEPAPIRDERGILWSVGQFTETIGPGCASDAPLTIHVDLPRPSKATRLGLVGALACAVELNNGDFGTLQTTDTHGVVRSYALEAGRDFSEWAYDCDDVRPAVRHQRAQIYRSYPVQRGTIQCQGHEYVTFLSLEDLQEIKRIALTYTGRIGTFALKKITLIDDDASESLPVNPVSGSLQDSSRFQYQGKIRKETSGYGPAVKAEDMGEALVYENLRASPRAWITPEVIKVSEEEALAAVRSSRLPDGAQFDWRRTTLVEEPVAPLQQGSEGKAQIQKLTYNTMELKTVSNGQSFLVTSDVYYPGWQVTVDGDKAHLYRANYALRGVVLPSGSHVVRFEFKPHSFYLGAILSAASIFLLVAALFISRMWVDGAVEGTSEC